MLRHLPPLLCLLTLFALPGCQSEKSALTPDALTQSNAVDEDSASSNRYAVNGDAQYAKPIKTNAEGEVINPLKAPSNQTYYFALNKNIVNPKDYQALTVQAIYLSTHPKATIRLEGNTDNRGSREYNIALGWRRNQAVIQLLEQQGVAKSQIRAISYGKEHPAIYGNNAYAWHLNRRVNLIYEAK